VKSKVNDQTNIIVGAAIDESLENKVHVSLVITGIPKKYQTTPIVVKKIVMEKEKPKEVKEKRSLLKILKNYW
jgi:cell division GTPase FtsZ